MPGKLIRNTIVFLAELHKCLCVPSLIACQISSRNFCIWIFFFDYVIDCQPVLQKLLTAILINIIVIPLPVRLIKRNIDYFIRKSGIFDILNHLSYFFRIFLHVLTFRLVRPLRVNIRTCYLYGVSSCFKECIRNLQHVTAWVLQSMRRILLINIGLQSGKQIHIWYIIRTKAIQKSRSSVFNLSGFLCHIYHQISGRSGGIHALILCK